MDGKVAKYPLIINSKEEERREEKKKKQFWKRLFFWKVKRYLESTGRVKELKMKASSTFLEDEDWAEETIDYEADSSAFMKQQGTLIIIITLILRE